MEKKRKIIYISAERESRREFFEKYHWLIMTTFIIVVVAGLYLYGVIEKYL